MALSIAGAAPIADGQEQVAGVELWELATQRMSSLVTQCIAQNALSSYIRDLHNPKRFYSDVVSKRFHLDYRMYHPNSPKLIFKFYFRRERDEPGSASAIIYDCNSDWPVTTDTDRHIQLLKNVVSCIIQKMDAEFKYKDKNLSERTFRLKCDSNDEVSKSLFFQIIIEEGSFDFPHFETERESDFV
ncbi:MAG: hypothetical protein WCF65_07305 [Parachlamydiaceae bacterium]